MNIELVFIYADHEQVDITSTSLCDTLIALRSYCESGEAADRYHGGYELSAGRLVQG